MKPQGDPKQQTALRLVGKKLFQLREAVATLPEIQAGPQFVKACQYAGTILEKLDLPADAAVLAIHPWDKIYRDPAAVPELLGDAPAAPASSVQPVDRSNHREFFSSMKTFADEAVLGREGKGLVMRTGPELSVTSKAASAWFSTTSEQRSRP